MKLSDKLEKNTILYSLHSQNKTDVLHELLDHFISLRYLTSCVKLFEYLKDEEIIFYSGLQILNIATLNNFSKKKFSINLIWDILINQEKLYGEIMQSDWFHIGDLKGLSIAKKLCT